MPPRDVFKWVKRAADTDWEPAELVGELFWLTGSETPWKASELHAIGIDIQHEVLIPPQRMEEFRDLLAGFKPDTQEASMVRALMATVELFQGERAFNKMKGDQA